MSSSPLWGVGVEWEEEGRLTGSLSCSRLAWDRRGLCLGSDPDFLTALTNAAITTNTCVHVGLWFPAYNDQRTKTHKSRLSILHSRLQITKSWVQVVPLDTEFSSRNLPRQTLNCHNFQVNMTPLWPVAHSSPGFTFPQFLKGKRDLESQGKTRCHHPLEKWKKSLNSSLHSVF